MKKRIYCSLAILALFLMLPIKFVQAESAVVPYALACGNCSTGALIETIGPIYTLRKYIPCRNHPGYHFWTDDYVRKHTFTCNKCHSTTFYEEYVMGIGSGCTSGMFNHY